MGSSSSTPAPVQRQREVRDGQKSFYLIMGKPPVTYTGNSSRPPLLYQVEVREAEAPELVDKAETLRNVAYVTPKQKVRLIRSNDDGAHGAVAAAPSVDGNDARDGYDLNFMVSFDPERCVSCEVDVFVNTSLLYTKQGTTLMPTEPPSPEGDEMATKEKKPGSIRTGFSSLKKSLGGGKTAQTQKGGSAAGVDGKDPNSAAAIASNRLLALDPSRQYHVFHQELLAAEGETLPPTQHFHSESIMLDQLDAELSAAAPLVEVNNDPTQSRAMALGLPASGNILIRLSYGLKVSREELLAKAKREREEKAAESGETPEDDGPSDAHGDDVGNWTGESNLRADEKRRKNGQRDDVLLSVTHDHDDLNLAGGGNDADGQQAGAGISAHAAGDYIIQKQVSYSLWNFDKSARERQLGQGSPLHPASPERDPASPRQGGELMTEPLLCFLCAQILEVHPPPLQPGEVREPEQNEVSIYKIDDVFDLNNDDAPVKSSAEKKGEGESDGDSETKPIDEVEVDDDDTCVVCLTENKDTVVLPCRHFCLCAGCAQLLRTQTNKCPICRQDITRLMTRNL